MQAKDQQLQHSRVQLIQLVKVADESNILEFAAYVRQEQQKRGALARKAAELAHAQEHTAVLQTQLNILQQASNFEKKVSAEKLSAKAKAAAQLQHRLTAAQYELRASEQLRAELGSSKAAVAKALEDLKARQAGSKCEECKQLRSELGSVKAARAKAPEDLKAKAAPHRHCRTSSNKSQRAAVVCQRRQEEWGYLSLSRVEGRRREHRRGGV